MSIEVAVSNLAGAELCRILAEPSWCVSDLKASLKSELGVRPDEQKLLLAESTAILSNVSVLKTVLPSHATVLELLLISINKWIQEVENDWKRLRRAPENIRNDQELVLAAIRASKGSAFKFAGDQVRANPEVVLAALELDTANARYVTWDDVKDEEVLRESLRKLPTALGYLTEGVRQKLLADKQFMLELVKDAPSISRFVKWDEQDDCIVEEVMRLAPSAFHHMPSSLQMKIAADKAQMLLLVRNYHTVAVLCDLVTHCDGGLRHDRDFVLEAVSTDERAFAALMYPNKLPPSELLNDHDFLAMLIRAQPGVLHSLQPREYLQRDLFLLGLQRDPYLVLSQLRQYISTLSAAERNRLKKSSTSTSTETKSSDALRQEATTLSWQDHQRCPVWKRTSLVDRGVVIHDCLGHEVALDNKTLFHKKRFPVTVTPLRQGYASRTASRHVDFDARCVTFETTCDLAQALLRDREVMLHICREPSCGQLLEYAGELCADRELVLEVARTSPSALRYASKELRRDPEVVVLAMEGCPAVFEFAATELRADPAFALAAVQRDGMNLRFVAGGLESDHAIVLASVQNDFRAIEFASQSADRDGAVVLALLQNMTEAWFVQLSAKDRKRFLRQDMILAALHEDGLALKLVPSTLRSIREVALAAVRQNGLALEFLPVEPATRAKQTLVTTSREDAAVVLAAVQQNGLALEFASMELKADYSIALAAVKQDPAAVKFAAKPLWEQLTAQASG